MALGVAVFGGFGWPFEMRMRLIYGIGATFDGARRQQEQVKIPLAKIIVPKLPRRGANLVEFLRKCVVAYRLHWRREDERSAIRFSAARAQARVYGDGRVDAGAGNRRDDGDFQRGECGVAAAA